MFDNELWVGNELAYMSSGGYAQLNYLILFPNHVLLDEFSEYMHYSLLEDQQSSGVGEFIIHILYEYFFLILPTFNSLEYILNDK